LRLKDYENEYEILRKRPNEYGMVPIRIRNKRTGKVSIKGNYMKLALALKFSRESPIKKKEGGKKWE